MLDQDPEEGQELEYLLDVLSSQWSLLMVCLFACLFWCGCDTHKHTHTHTHTQTLSFSLSLSLSLALSHTRTHSLSLTLSLSLLRTHLSLFPSLCSYYLSPTPEFRGARQHSLAGDLTPNFRGEGDGGGNGESAASPFNRTCCTPIGTLTHMCTV